MVPLDRESVLTQLLDIWGEMVKNCNQNWQVCGNLLKTHKQSMAAAMVRPCTNIKAGPKCLSIVREGLNGCGEHAALYDISSRYALSHILQCGWYEVKCLIFKYLYPATGNCSVIKNRKIAPSCDIDNFIILFDINYIVLFITMLSVSSTLSISSMLLTLSTLSLSSPLFNTTLLILWWVGWAEKKIQK